MSRSSCRWSACGGFLLFLLAAGMMLNVPGFAFQAGTAAVSLRVVDEVAPAGGLALIRIELTEPKPISGGRVRFSFDGALAFVTPLAANAGPLASIAAVGFLSSTGDVLGSASTSGNTAIVDFTSPRSTYGMDAGIPLMVFAVPVDPGASAGSKVSLTLDLANSHFLDPSGKTYIAEVKQGTFTVGGVSITKLKAPSRNLIPGSIITLTGIGFQQGGKVAIEGNEGGSTRILSSQQIEVTVGSNLKVDNLAVRLTNPDGSNDFFYAIPQLTEVGGTRRDDLLGTWLGQGLFSRNSDTGAWSFIASPAKRIAAGDMDGDGKDDLIGSWPDSGVWIKYSTTGQWALMASPAQWIAMGDLNGDHKSDLIGIWDSTIWSRDSATGTWSSVSSGATQVTAGDLDGDSKADLVGNWPGSGVWVKYSLTGQWAPLASPADWIATADLNGDGRAELLGVWNSTIWSRDSVSGTWSLISSGATQVTAGDLDGDGKLDLIGNWPESGVWVKHSSTDSWEHLSSVADGIAAGKLR